MLFPFVTRPNIPSRLILLIHHMEIRLSLIIPSKLMTIKTVLNSVSFPVLRLQTVTCPLSFTERNATRNEDIAGDDWRIGMH